MKAILGTRKVLEKCYMRTVHLPVLNGYEVLSFEGPNVMLLPQTLTVFFILHDVSQVLLLKKTLIRI